MKLHKNGTTKRKHDRDRLRTVGNEWSNRLNKACVLVSGGHCG